MPNMKEGPEELSRELEILGESMETILSEARRQEDTYKHEMDKLASELKLKELVTSTLDNRIRSQREENDKQAAELAKKASGLRSLLLKKCDDLKAFHERLQSEISSREDLRVNERRYFEERLDAQALEIDQLSSELRLLRDKYAALEKVRQGLLSRIAGLTEANEKLALFRRDQELARAALEKELEKKEQDRILDAERAAQELIERSAGFRAALAVERDNHKAAYEKLERDAQAREKKLARELADLNGAYAKIQQEFLGGEPGQPDAVLKLGEALIRKYVEIEQLTAETGDLKTAYDAIKSGLEANLSEIKEQGARLRSLLSVLKEKESAAAPDREQKERTGPDPGEAQ